MSNACFLGRLCPPHKGHERIIRQMIDENSVQNCLVIIGSAQIISDRVPFSYNKRREWINKLFPNVRVTYLDDKDNDEKWLEELNKILLNYFYGEKVTFYGGSNNDIYFFNGLYNIKIVDRSVYNISGTDVRKNLDQFGTTFKLVSEKIKDDVEKEYKMWKIKYGAENV